MVLHVQGDPFRRSEPKTPRLDFPAQHMPRCPAGPDPLPICIGQAMQENPSVLLVSDRAAVDIDWKLASLFVPT